MDFASFLEESCLARDPERPDMLLFGDSHAAHLLSAFRQNFPDVHFAQANAAGCKPLLDPEGTARCVGLFNYVFDEVMPQGQFDGVIVSARWTPEHLAALPETVDYLSRYANHVIVLGPTIEYKLPLPRLLATQAEPGTPPDLESFDRYEQLAELDSAMRDAVGDKATYVSILGALCPEGECTPLTPSGEPIAYDYGHFTLSGADFVLDLLRGEEVHSQSAPLENLQGGG
jgi:hypothetical protein